VVSFGFGFCSDARVRLALRWRWQLSSLFLFYRRQLPKPSEKTVSTGLSFINGPELIEFLSIVRT